MIANYYTLLHVARDLDSRLSGKPFVEIFSQNKNELVLRLGEECVVVSCEPSLNYLVLRPAFPRAKRNSLDFFEELSGCTVRSVSLSMDDREVIFRVDNRQSLVVQMFGAKANVLLVHSDYTIRSSFLRQRECVGTEYTTRQEGQQGYSNEHEFVKTLATFADTPLRMALKKMFPQLGSGLVQELLDRTSIRSDGRASDEDAKALFRSYVSLLSSLTSSPSPVIYYSGSNPKAFSIVPLHQCRELKSQTFDSLHEAIRAFVAGHQRDKQFFEEKSLFIKTVGREVERCRRTLHKLSEEMGSGDRAVEYETIGKLLMTNLASVHKGMDKVRLENIFETPASVLTVFLQAGLTPAQNAERYFQKSKKARASQRENAQRKDQLAQRLQRGQNLLDELEQIDSAAGMQNFAGENRRLLADFGVVVDKRGKKSQEERIPFRVFTVKGGFQVWVGKSSENNDLLTMKYARPDDLWFHARGSSGSHVVLKIGTANGEPGKHAIEQAASIAAYYSKMRNAKTVPVAMTQRKYVRKPRGAPAGAVTVEREELHFVEPKLPAHS